MGILLQMEGKFTNPFIGDLMNPEFTILHGILVTICLLTHLYKRGRLFTTERFHRQWHPSLFPSEGCSTFGVDILLDAVPVTLIDIKPMDQVTCKKKLMNNFLTQDPLPL